jgi:hypothetical protein
MMWLYAVLKKIRKRLAASRMRQGVTWPAWPFSASVQYVGDGLKGGAHVAEIEGLEESLFVEVLALVEAVCKRSIARIRPKQHAQRPRRA